MGSELPRSQLFEDEEPFFSWLYQGLSEGRGALLANCLQWLTWVYIYRLYKRRRLSRKRWVRKPWKAPENP